MVQFEGLCNELLLDIFEYLDTGHLMCSFSQLSARFDRLISMHYHYHTFNMQSMPKYDFDLICEQSLPYMIDQIHSLYLSERETPTLVRLLFSRGFTLDRFTHLQSLTLDYIYSDEVLNNILLQCRSIVSLTKLTILQYDNLHEEIEQMQFLENTWQLPHLTDCHLNGMSIDEMILLKMTTASTSIKNLFIEKIRCNVPHLFNLLTQTPQLERLAVTVYSYINTDLSIITMPLLKSLKLIFGGSLYPLKIILQSVPNLEQLKIQTTQTCINGTQWQELIEDHLLKLKRFQLLMEFSLMENDESMEVDIDRLLNTFQSVFWLEERQWFVLCHWNPSDPDRSTILYTLPYAFPSFHYCAEFNSKSTCAPKHDNVSSMRLMKAVRYVSLTYDDVIDIPYFLSCCPEIHRLDIDIIFGYRQTLTLPRMNQLTTLNVCIYHELCFPQLQTFLNHAPHLHSLAVILFILSKTNLFQLKSSSVRRLNLIDTRSRQPKCFTDNECHQLIQSSLGQQCEVLFIHVQYRKCILDLIQGLPNLRTLSVRCGNDQKIFRRFYFAKQTITSWLRNHLLPSDLVISGVSVDFLTQIWIDREARRQKTINEKTMKSKSESRWSRLLMSCR